MTASYSLTGNGSALVENLSAEGRVVMTSVYHMDGDALRVTHFCAAGNQPRSREVGSLEGFTFEMTDITNLRDPGAPHVDRIEIVPDGGDRLTIRFRMRRGDRASIETVELRRIAAAL